MNAAPSYALPHAPGQPEWRLPPPAAELRLAERYGLIGGVAAVHALALWALLQLGAVQEAVRQMTPVLMVDLLTLQPPRPPEPAPRPPAPATPTPRRPTTPTAPMLSPVVSAAPAPAPPPAAVSAVDEPAAVSPPASAITAAPAATPPLPTAAPPAPPLPPSPPAPPQPRLLPASNIAYLVAPPIELPLVSRRLGEQGLVLLRVLVGVDGLPRQVSVQRSSGFARLDEQAIAAMKRARFKPQTDHGEPIEWIVVAPLQYEIE